MSFRTFALAALLLGGCATEDQVKKLEDRIAMLEKKVDEQGSRPGARAPGGPPSAANAPAVVNSEEETAAQAALKELQDMASAGKIELLPTKISDFNTKYGSTTTAQRARKLLGELGVIGKDAPKELKVDKWFQGEGKVNLASTKPIIYVFWEVWCPHCRKELPEMESGVWKNFAPKGVEVVALTRITKGKTEDDVKQFISENHLTFPIAKESGDLATYFAVSGIPAAAVVKGGKVVWRGHPNGLTDDLLNGML